jgi:hypothetical protein
VDAGTLWAITTGLLENQNKVAAVGRSKLSIQSNIVAIGKSILLFFLLQLCLMLSCRRFKANEEY